MLREYPIIDAKEEAEVAHDTAVCIYMWLFKVCSTKLLQTPICWEGLVLSSKLMNHFSAQT